MVHNRLRNLRIIDQALDHIVTTSQFERFYRSLQSLIQPSNRTFSPYTKKPTYRRKQEMRRKSYASKQDNKNKGPEGQRNRLGHRGKMTGNTAMVNPTMLRRGELLIAHCFTQQLKSKIYCIPEFRRLAMSHSLIVHPWLFRNNAAHFTVTA